jgi:hypothetical protein
MEIFNMEKILTEDINEPIEKHYRHVLLELFCMKDSIDDCPLFCKKGIGQPGYHCLVNECIYKAYTYANQELCYTSEFGEVPNSNCFVAFGGEMEDDGYSKDKEKKLENLWQTICEKKIAEAYVEYMQLKNTV